MSQSQESLMSLLHMLNKIENDVAKAKAFLQKQFGEGETAYTSVPMKPAAPTEEDGVQIVEGTYDGNFMQGSDGKSYPVPMNYASKTKLVA